MGAKTRINGNLGGNPELKYIDVNGGSEQRAVCSFTVFQSHRRKNKQTGEYEDAGGFWVSVTAWGRLAEYIHPVLKKGYPVIVEGDQYLQKWTDNDNVARETICMDANDVSLSLYNVSEIKLKPKQNQTQEPTPDDSQPEAVNQNEDPFAGND